MSKYEALGRFLRDQRMNEIPMTFADIERITGTKLPPSARKHRPWWSNNPRNSVMTQVWLDAGFQTEQVNMDSGKLVFRRVVKAGRRAAAQRPAPQGSAGDNRHPLFGAMKGLMRIAPGTDLTQPADPEWGKD
jgi:hypothetical protein